jgi:tetratricopeptide (TPR) repeat protein
MRKFARRHKGLVAGVLAVFVVLLGGIAASTWEAVRARRAKQTAVNARQQAQAVNDFLQNDLLAQASADAQAAPDTQPDPDLKVRTALDRAAAKIGGRFATQPLIEASIRDTIGITYRDLGLYPEAERQVARALELRRRSLGEQDPETLNAAGDLADLYERQGRYAEAESLLLQTLETRRRLVGDSDPHVLDHASNLAWVYYGEGKYAQAEELERKTLEAARRVLGEESPLALTLMGNLSLTYDSEGKYEAAEALAAKALELTKRRSGEEHPETLIAMNNLALVYTHAGKVAEGEALDLRGTGDPAPRSRTRASAHCGRSE